MKKVIATLIIAIVLIGAVFATDDAAIQVTVKVNELVPTFKLITSGNTNLKEGTSEGSDAVAASGSSTPGSITLADSVGAALADGTDAAVKFNIVQVPNAEGKIKTTKTYSFEITATDLKLNGTETDANKKFTVKTVSSITKITDAIDSRYATITPGTTASIQYTGKNYHVDADVSFAEFTVTWTGNDAAVAGDYQATVTLTMTTTT